MAFALQLRKKHEKKTTNASFLFLNSSTSFFIYQWSVNCTGYTNSLSSLVGHHTYTHTHTHTHIHTHTLLIYYVSTEALPINATHLYDNTDTWLALVSFCAPAAQLKLTDYQCHSLPSVGELQDLLAWRPIRVWWQSPVWKAALQQSTAR